MSPEMIMCGVNKKEGVTYDRRKKQGAGVPSDIWSLGCIFYEVLTGKYLFEDSDVVRFMVRVTQANQELFRPEVVQVGVGYIR